MSSNCIRKGGCGDAKAYGLDEFADVCTAGGGTVGRVGGPGAIERAAYEKGYQAGQEAGYAFGEKQAALLVERLQGIIDGLESFRARVLAETEPQLVALALRIARKVIHGEVTTNREVVVQIAREALQGVSEDGDIVIRLHPGDLDHLAARQPELCRGGRSVRLEPDEQVGPGGCLVETAHGEIDGRLEEQLDEIENGLESVSGTEEDKP